MPGPGTDFWGFGSGGGGTSDHGALTGLSDDDHPQYLLLSDVLDEDDMASDSATVPPSQQSVKAYVLANAGGASTPSYQPTFSTHTNTWSFLPGVVRVVALGNYTFGSDRWVVSQALIPEYDITITDAEMYVNTAIASSFLRPLICTADSDWQPSSIVWQSSYDSSTTGRKSDTGLSVSLTAGTRYLVLARADSGAVAVKYFALNSTLAAPAHVDSAEGNTTWGSFTSTASSGVWATPLPGLVGMQSVSYMDFIGCVWFKYGAT